jgi:hypothetical protein
VAECGGLLNHRGIFRFSHFNHLQSGRNRPNRATVLSFGGVMLPALLPTTIILFLIVSSTIAVRNVSVPLAIRAVPSFSMAVKVEANRRRSTTMAGEVVNRRDIIWPS